jgi:hypothetical protein
MDIRFISSLTPEDENRVGPSLLQAITSLLDNLPLAYTLRIETTGERIFQHDHIAPKAPEEFRVATPIPFPTVASDH